MSQKYRFPMEYASLNTFITYPIRKWTVKQIWLKLNTNCPSMWGLGLYKYHNVSPPFSRQEYFQSGNSRRIKIGKIIDLHTYHVYALKKKINSSIIVIRTWQWCTSVYIKCSMCGHQCQYIVYNFIFLFYFFFWGGGWGGKEIDPWPQPDPPPHLHPNNK